MVTIREDGTILTRGIIAKEAGGVTREVDMGVVIREGEAEAGETKILAVITNRVIVGALQGTNNTATIVLHHITWIRPGVEAAAAATAAEMPTTGVARVAAGVEGSNLM